MNKYQSNKAQDAIQKQAHTWLIRLESGQATEEDAKAFKRWCTENRAHATAFSEARKVWAAMVTAGQPVRQQARMEKAASAHLRGRRMFIGGAVAACAGYLALRPPLDLWMSMPELIAGLAADYKTNVGEQRSIALSQGVTVQMNTQTRLNVAKTDKITKLVLLSGEAGIKSDGNDGQVTVVAGNGVISVQQAVLNVRYINDSVCVTCLQGRASIVQAGIQETVLVGEQVIFTGKLPVVREVANTAVVTAWRQRMLVFQQATLGDVIDEVNRYRPGKLVLRGETLKKNRVQANFSLDRLDDVIALIRDAYGASVTYLPGGVVLLREMSV